MQKAWLAVLYGAAMAVCGEKMKKVRLKLGKRR